MGCGTSKLLFETKATKFNSIKSQKYLQGVSKCPIEFVSDRGLLLLFSLPPVFKALQVSDTWNL
jgi:hypothetical protein